MEMCETSVALYIDESVSLSSLYDRPRGRGFNSSNFSVVKLDWEVETGKKEGY